jgi:Ca2+/Na+ antiporter
MVVSNSVGSNLFDILVGLGLPWLLSNLFISKSSSIKIDSKGLFYSTSVLLLTVLLTLALMRFLQRPKNVRTPNETCRAE